MWVHGVSHCSTCHLSRIEYPKMRAVMAQQGENLHITTTSFLTGRPKCTHYPNIVVWVKLLNISSKIRSHSAKGEQERSQSGSRWEICISWLLTTVFVAEWPKFTLIWIGLMSVLQLIMLTLNVSRSRGVQTLVCQTFRKDRLQVLVLIFAVLFWFKLYFILGSCL